MRRVMKMVMFFVMFVVFCFVVGLVVEHLWNWLMPTLFGLKRITYWQAVGLLVLCKILLGGFHKHGGARGHNWNAKREWKRRMHERWATMSDEERAAFRAGMKGRWGCYGGRDEQPTERVAQ